MEASFDSGSMKVTFRGIPPSPTLQSSQNVTQPQAKVEYVETISPATEAIVKVSAQEFSGGATVKQVVVTPL